MRRISSLVAVATIALGLASFVACVGDDPGEKAESPPDGSTPDSTTLTDSTTSDTSTSVEDAGGDADAGPLCDRSKPFGGLTPVSGLPTVTTPARLSNDELTAYFTMDPEAGGRAQLYFATRALRTAPFGSPSFISGVNPDAGAEEHASISADGLTLFFIETDDVWYATRSSLLGAFSNPQIVGGVNSASIERYVSSTSDGELWFTSTRDGNEGFYRAPLTGSGFGTPVAVTELNSATEPEAYPTLTADKLEIFFTRGTGVGTRDIWTAKRTTPTGTFSTPTLVTELNTTDDERSGWISPDGCRLYVGKGPSGVVAMFVTSRPAL